jgi:DNA-binding LacI/PurR family transcriptional regulator
VGGCVRQWARHHHAVVLSVEVPHVRAHLRGRTGKPQLDVGSAQPIVHEAAAVAGGGSVDYQRGSLRRPVRTLRLGAQHTAGRHRSCPDKSDNRSKASHTYEHTTYDLLVCQPPRGCIAAIEQTTQQRVTSIDVARCAGVSQSTVSLVFSGKGRGRVSDATQARVRRCARELGYRPNVAAQALRLGASRAVALLVPDITNPFFSRVLRGAQRAAQEAGYTVALVDTANDRRWEAQSFEALRAGPVDGYLLFEVSRPEALGPDQHVVLMETEASRCPSVRFDAEGGAAAAFAHLLELGHRRIAHLAAKFDAPTFQLREKARRRVLGEAGLDPNDLPRAATGIGIDDARDAAGPLLAKEPTAVFCDDDIIAAGVYLAARESALRIPADLSVVGFDDMDFARVLDPPLTTVALDAEQLGASAFELLEARMAGRRTRRRIVLPAELLVRGSTAAPG